MRSAFTVCTLTLFCLCLIPLSASAELKPADHNGFYIGFGVGGGSAGLSIDNSSIDLDREGGAAVDIRIGAALRNDLLLGAEIDAWRKEVGGFALQYNNYAACLTWYPTEMFFIKGGPAIAVVLAEAFGFTDTETGIGFSAGAGAELRLTTKFALVPSVQFCYQDLDGYSTDFFTGLLGFNWFW